MAWPAILSLARVEMDELWTSWTINGNEVEYLGRTRQAGGCARVPLKSRNVDDDVWTGLP